MISERENKQRLMTWTMLKMYIFKTLSRGRRWLGSDISENSRIGSSRGPSFHRNNFKDEQKLSVHLSELWKRDKVYSNQVNAESKKRQLTNSRTTLRDLYLSLLLLISVAALKITGHAHSPQMLLSERAEHT